jgi:class 3 adenylate cyclase/tetratricopeptide (TPR) repeat protein
MVVCPSCGQENPEGFRFCGACAAPLDVEPPAEREERKVVSVLFVDLVGFTDRSDRADPEDVRAALRPYHARLKQEVERFAGTVEKFVGDAVLAVFGAPVAHEDDAERAVRSALRILEAIRDLNDQHGLDLAVRAAVNTGEAVVALGARPEAGEGIVTGDVVNTAARLQQAAPVGGIVVGEVTRRSTRDLIEYEELAPVSVKGKAEPIPIWRVVGARARYGVDVEQPATPFVGREDELQLLKQTYVRTLRESSVQLVTVTGEPGVGKTRLISELRAYVDEQAEMVHWRQGRCLPYGEGITFWALGEIVKNHAGVLESDAPGEAGEKLDAALRTVVAETAERDWLRGRLAPLVGLAGAGEEQAAAQAELFTAWRRFIEAVASARPLVLVFEDLHWADGAMLEFLEHLVEWAVDVPLLVACSARPELYERAPGWGGGKRNSTTIALTPLSGAETARLVSALVSQVVLPTETQAALLERAGGNPLYAEEFARMLMDRGLLERRGRSLHIVEGGEIPVPESVQALIAARLDTLSAERKSLLHDAAVFGKVFWAGALAAMGDSAESAVEEGLHELARKELVRASRTSSVARQAEYAFWHLLVRDVAYGQIPRAARADRHRAAAEWIEQMAEDRVADHAELLVHHYGQARELAQSAGADAQARELEGPLRSFLVIAGDRAMELDVAKAQGYYRRALELLPAGDPERPTLLVKFSWAAEASGGASFAECERNLEDAIAEFEKRGDARGAGDATIRLSVVRSRRGDTVGARALRDRALELLQGGSPGPEVAYAYAAMAGSYMLSGDAQECLEWSNRTLELAERLRLTEEIVRARNFRGMARCELGDFGGLDDLRESLRFGLEAGLATLAVSAQNNLGDWVWLIEGAEAGLEAKREAGELAKSRGLTGIWVAAETCWPLYDVGAWDELLRVADEIAEIEQTRGKGQAGAIALSQKANVLVHRGNLDLAIAFGEELLGRARAIEDRQVLAPALTVSALLEQSRGDLPAALSLIAEFEKLTSGTPSYRAHYLLDALRVCLAAGAMERAESLLVEAGGAAARHRHAVLTAHAVLAEARGELVEASTRYAEAAELWAEYGFVLEEGQAQLGRGRSLIGIGRMAEGAAPLETARKLFQGLGAAPLIAEADTLLARAA